MGYICDIITSGLLQRSDSVMSRKKPVAPAICLSLSKVGTIVERYIVLILDRSFHRNPFVDTFGEIVPNFFKWDRLESFKKVPALAFSKSVDIAGLE